MAHAGRLSQGVYYSEPSMLASIAICKLVVQVLAVSTHHCITITGTKAST